MMLAPESQMPETELSMVVQDMDPGPFRHCCVVLDMLSSFAGPQLQHLLSGGEKSLVGWPRNLNV